MHTGKKKTTMVQHPARSIANIPDPNRPFAKFFRRWMKERGFTRPAQAAEVLKVSITTVYDWSNGTATIPRSRLAIFAPRFGVSLLGLAQIVLPKKESATIADKG